MIRTESVRVVDKAQEMCLFKGHPHIQSYEMDATTEWPDEHDSPSQWACQTKERDDVDTFIKLDVQDMEARTMAISS